MNRLGALAAALLLCGCGRAPGFTNCQPPAGGVTVAMASASYPDLSDYCLVDASNGQMIVNPEAVPYDLNTPLFSDYALKSRVVWVPPGQTVQYSPDQPFTFPVGTILAKTFSFAPDLRTPTVGLRMVETRLLIHNVDGWISLPYVWNADQTDATLDLAGVVQSFTFISPMGQTENANYLVPQANQCGACHNVGTTLTPIGPKARQLNRDYAYATGSENQLAHWTRIGLLTGAPTPDVAPKLAVWDDPSTGTLDQRARAWLEGNCAHCHSDTGLARTTGLTLWSAETNPVKWGLCKHPVAAGPATGGRLYDIVPGQPDASVMVYRLESTTPGIMMPQIGRSVVSAEGVALIRQWISSLPGTCP